jgi:glyoxylase-like metal-dependent hydrolase (beta-lactamase superfamily II)
MDDAKPAIRVFIIDCGLTITHDAPHVHISGKKETRSLSEPNRCYLVEHPKGLLVWDTGLPDSYADQPEGVSIVNGMFRFVLPKDKTLAGQLALIGFAPDQITYLAFSHLHIDHAGNGNMFPGATVLIHEREYMAAFAPGAAEKGYPVQYFGGIQNQTVRQLAGEYDVFGDGSVVMLEAPGHTVGHMALFVDLIKAGPIVLSGDICYSEQDRAARWVPDWNADKAAAFETLDRIDAYCREKGARLIINHDAAQNATLPLAPVYLD